MSNKKNKKKKKNDETKKMVFSAFIASNYDWSREEHMGVYALKVYREGYRPRTVSKVLFYETPKRIELKAAIEVFDNIQIGSTVKIYSNDAYIVNILSGKWSPKENIDLVLDFRRASACKEVKMILEDGVWRLNDNNNIVKQRFNNTCDLAFMYYCKCYRQKYIRNSKHIILNTL